MHHNSLWQGYNCHLEQGLKRHYNLPVKGKKKDRKHKLLTLSCPAVSQIRNLCSSFWYCTVLVMNDALGRKTQVSLSSLSYKYILLRPSVCLAGWEAFQDFCQTLVGQQCTVKCSTDKKDLKKTTHGRLLKQVFLEPPLVCRGQRQQGRRVVWCVVVVTPGIVTKLRARWVPFVMVL